MTRLPAARHAAAVALGAFLVLAFAALAYLGRDTTFFYDEWNFWVEGPSFAPGQLLEPYNGQASVVPRLWWSLVATIFGDGNYDPFRLTWYPLHLALMAGIFVLLRRRAGEWVSLATVLPLTLLGTALASLALWMPITGLYFVLPLTWFVWALVALDRETRRGDAVACVLLVLSAFTASSGLAPLAGVAAWLLWERPQWRRLWVVGVPVALFALWYAVQRPENEQEITLSDVTLIPSYVVEGMANGFATYTGLDPSYGWAPTVAVIAGFAVAIARGGRIGRAAVAVGAAGLTYWALLAIGRGPEIRPHQARYLYPDVVYAIVPAVLLLGALRPDPRRAGLVALVLAAAFGVTNLEAFVDTMRDQRGKSQLTRAELTALELATSPRQGALRIYDYRPLIARGDPALRGAAYVTGIRERGRDPVGYDAEEVETLPEHVRRQIDTTSLQLLQVGSRPRTEPLAGATCRTLRPTTEPTVSISFPAGEPFTVQALGPKLADLRLRRYATQFLPTVKPFSQIGRRTPAVVDIPADRSDRPWEANVASFGPFRVCAQGL